jgi:hypothetical protein
MKRFFIYAPLLFLPVLIYNIIAMTSTGVSDPQALLPVVDKLNAVLVKIPMLSGGRWGFTLGDVLLLMSLVMLFVEIIKSTSTRSMALINHALSMMLLLFCLVEFLLMKNFATSVFFLITVMTLLDVLAGFMVSVVSARRDFGVGEGIIG